MNNKGILPKDLIADGADYTQINGVQVRKGSVAAFIANIDLLENPNSSADAKGQAIHVMKELAPAIVAAGLHLHVSFKNSLVEEIIQQTAKRNLSQRGSSD